MHQRSVYVVTDDQESSLADELVGRLEREGYEVISNRTVSVGESVVSAAARAIHEQVPVVLCATKRAVGSNWTQRIADAARMTDRGCVLIVQMEPDVNLNMVAFGTKVAPYHEDSESAVQEVIRALDIRYRARVTAAFLEHPGSPGREWSLDHPTFATAVDIQAVEEFRSMLREEIRAQFPSALNTWEFLDRAGLRVSDGRLTGNGVLLFAQDTGAINSSVVVQCREYLGTDVSNERTGLNINGALFRQIMLALRFVAERVGTWEAPSPGSAAAAAVYELPMVAVREIIANALVHRDYSADYDCVHVRLFADRLEVASPGSWLGRELPDGGETDLGAMAGPSLKRNFRLAQILYWIRLVEGEGSGIPTALRDCREHGNQVPVVKFDHGIVNVTIRRHRRASRAVPAMLPAGVQNFTGRSEELAKLNNLLLDERYIGRTAIISAIGGGGGIGKTALALHWARRVVDRFPDGQLYVDLRGFDPTGKPMEPKEAVRRFLDALGVLHEKIPVDSNAQFALYRSLLAGKRMLVLLDNAYDTEQVRPLLPGSPQCLVLITSRNPLTGLIAAEGAQPIAIDLFTFDEAWAMLADRLGRARLVAEPQAANEIISRCARLPLALAIVAARAATRPHLPLAMLADELADMRERLDALAGDEPYTDMRAVFSWSYQSLTAAAARVFQLLGLHPGPDITAPAAASLAGLPLSETRALLNELIRASLLAEYSLGRFTFHDLLRAYATELVHTLTSDERQEAVGRLLTHYLRIARKADQFLDPNWESFGEELPVPGVVDQPITSHHAAIGWFAAERANLLAAVRLAIQDHFDTHAYQLAWSLITFLSRSGDQREWAEVGQTALMATRRLRERQAEARAHRILASAYVWLKRYPDAYNHYMQALDLFNEFGDVTGKAHTHLMLGRLFDWQADHRRALIHAQSALALYQELDDWAWQARVLNDIGRTYGKLGNHQDGLSHCWRALKLCVELGDRDGEATTLADLAELLRHSGQMDRAIAYYRKSATIRAEIGDRHNQVRALLKLAEVLDATGRHADAQAANSEAQEIRAQIAEGAIENEGG